MIKPLVVADGTLEALKWLGLVLMTLDHINKYLFAESLPGLFEAGRLAVPIFCFVLAYNLARPDALRRGVYQRTMQRLALYGLLASPFFIALGGWWPLNILFMLLVATATTYLLEQGGTVRIMAAVAVFIFGGLFVEFWWPALALCLAGWRYCKAPSKRAAAVLVAAMASLYLINRNHWALAALPVIFAAPYFNIRMPRWRHVFYAYYPAHLGLLLAVSSIDLLPHLTPE